jgi:hypothetical protein
LTIEGYFLVCDLLGFSKIVQNSSEQELSERIQAWVNLVEQAASDCHVTSTQLISDTVFAAAGPGGKELRSLVDFARRLLSCGILQSLPIRGAITYGTYEWGRLTYGKAVVRAHSLEMGQNWIGVTCDNNLPDVSQLWGPDSLICFPAPMRSALIMLYPVVTWDIPSSSKLSGLLTWGGLSKKGDGLTWDWADKLNNTVLLDMYRKWLIAMKLSGDSFHGGFGPLNLFSERLVFPQSPK